MLSRDAHAIADLLSSRYRFEREIGVGGMATVYLAEDLKHRRQVAVKILRPELAAGVTADRFVQEIEIVARLRHPHILPLFDSGEAGDALYYVMPYVEGESLRARLTRDHQLPVDEAVRLAREIADALAYAHSQGVVHRDIKPENVLLESGHAVVADFGIARAIVAATTADSSNTRLTTTGVALGTPVYMSPEQGTGDRDVDGRSDIYSLGCVLYEMLCGEPPFTGSTVGSLVHQHLVNVAPIVTDRRPAVPEFVASAVSRAMAKNPADRFETAAEFAAQLASPTTSSPSRRSTRPRAIAGVATVAVLGAGVWAARDRGPGRGSNGAVDQPHVVVIMPFSNLSADSSKSYFASGISEEITTALSRLSALRVLSPSAVRQFVAAPDRLQRLANDLGVGSIVEGSVRVHGDSALITTTLTDAHTGTVLLRTPINRALADALSVQSEVARSIADVLQARLTPAEMRRRGRPPTVSLEAYELYLRTKGLSRQNPDQNREAMALLRRAIALDSGFARAHVSLALSYLFLAYGRGAAYLDSGSTEAKAAIAADPELPHGHFALADLQTYGGHLTAARSSFLRALELNPSYDAAMQDLSMVEDFLGRYDESLHWNARAFLLAPNSPDAYYHLETALVRIGLDSTNERIFQSALDRFPNDSRLQLTFARLDILRRRDSAAVVRARRVLERSPKNQEAQYFVAELATITDAPDAATFIEPLVKDAPEGRGDFLAESYRTQLGRLLAKRGERAKADSIWAASAALASQQLAAGNENPALPLELAAISTMRGDTTAAFASIEQSYRMGWKDPRILALDPFFATLRDTPHFRTLISRMNADLLAMRRTAAAAYPQFLGSVGTRSSGAR